MSARNPPRPEPLDRQRRDAAGRLENEFVNTLSQDHLKALDRRPVVTDKLALVLAQVVKFAAPVAGITRPERNGWFLLRAASACPAFSLPGIFPPLVHPCSCPRHFPGLALFIPGVVGPALNLPSPSRRAHRQSFIPSPFGGHGSLSNR